MKSYRKFYIDGQWIDPLGSKTFDVINPATEDVIATIAMGNAEDVNRAVSAAREAFPSFSSTTKQQRVELLERVINAFGKREADLAAAVISELGSPVSTKIHVAGPLEGFRESLKTLKAYDFESRIGNTVVRREPIGVCGLITPWNWPVQTIVTKLAPALAAGCTVVVKPSEFTPLSAIVLAEILHDAGLPKGVFNLLNGDGPIVGSAICQHPDVDFVSFTGSTRAGIQVALAAAPTVKRVCQELGGKSANVILPDADLKAAAGWNIGRAFFNTGQSCHAPTRALVQERQVDEVLRHMVAEVEKIKVGDPLDPSTTMGPLVNKAQFERVQHYIQRGIDEGARLVCGGVGRPDGLQRGYFVKPTVFADVQPTMAIAREEIFGPVLAVVPYSTVDEAVKIANDTPYGLGAYVWSKDPKIGSAVCAQMRAGRVSYNGAPSNAASPMGGYKQSGNGREMGVFGLEEYLEVKAVFGLEEPAAV